PPLVALVESLLQKSPDNRPDSAEQVGEALAAVELGLPPNLEGTMASFGSGSGPFSSPHVPLGPTRQVASTASAGPSRLRKSRRIAVMGGISLLAVVALATVGFLMRPGGTGGLPSAPTGPPIRIGVLHSRTGTMAISERPVVDAVSLAVEEINGQ